MAGDTANKLKELRRRAGLSIARLADSVGKEKSAYQHYEDRFKKPLLPQDLTLALVAPLTATGKVTKGEVLALGGLSDPIDDAVDVMDMTTESTGVTGSNGAHDQGGIYHSPGSEAPLPALEIPNSLMLDAQLVCETLARSYGVRLTPRQRAEWATSLAEVFVELDLLAPDEEALARVARRLIPRAS